MANKKEKLNLNYDWKKLELAQVAESYLKEQGEQGLPFAKKSLELILKDIGVAEPWLIKTISDPEVIQKTIRNQLEVYNEFKQEQTVSDIIKYNSGTLEDYLGKDSGRVSKELEPFMNRKYLDIQKEIGEAKYMIEGKEKYGKGSDEDVEKYKKVIEKYDKVVAAVSILESRKHSKLRNRVEDATTKEVMQNIFLPKKEESKKVA